MKCDAKIRPFPNDTELECESLCDSSQHEGFHEAMLRDYAYSGSATKISWEESDRRTFRGEWRPCSITVGCVLPGGHPRACAL